jgi:4'-phosphopantetheinyl transferase
VTQPPPARLWLHSLARAPAAHELACLAPAELQRAARFAMERHRRRFLAARVALRQRLSQHLQMPAGALRFVEGPHGKPALADAPDCHFNLSHSEDVALVGIGEVCEIGVDIEMLRPVEGALALARSHFTDAEYGAFVALDDASRVQAFLRAWTRKEACMKALGTGLSVEPRAFATGLSTQRVELSVELAQGRVPLAMCSVDLGPDVVAAVAWINEPARR